MTCKIVCVEGMSANEFASVPAIIISLQGSVRYACQARLAGQTGDRWHLRHRTTGLAGRTRRSVVLSLGPAGLCSQELSTGLQTPDQHFQNHKPKLVRRLHFCLSWYPTSLFPVTNLLCHFLLALILTDLLLLSGIEAIVCSEPRLKPALVQAPIG